MEELDRREESQGLVGDERETHGELRGELKMLVEMEEIAWRQKFRIKWLKRVTKALSFSQGR